MNEIDHDPEPTIHDVMTRHPKYSEAELYTELEKLKAEWQTRQEKE